MKHEAFLAFWRLEICWAALRLPVIAGIQKFHGKSITLSSQKKTTKTSTFAILRTRSSINQSFFLVARRSSIYQAVSLFPVAQFRMKKIPAQNYPQSSDHWMNSITPIGSMEMIYVPTFIIKINQSWLILIANVGKYFISMDASWDCGFGFSWFNLRTWPCQSISRSLGFISEPELSAPGGIFRGPWKNYRLYGCFLTWWYPPFHTPPFTASILKSQFQDQHSLMANLLFLYICQRWN